jgi:hypothetical protein
MEGHVKVLGIIYLVYGGLLLLIGLGLMLFFGGLAGVAARESGREGGLILGALGGFLMFVFLILSLPSVLAGWGLLNFKEWARILTIVLSALSLFGFPIGTLIGAYGLWVLLNQQTAPLFQKR